MPARMAPSLAAINTDEPELVPNHGLAAVTLILLIAFALVSAFALRHSKLAPMYHHTTVAVSRQLYSSGVKSPPIRGPD